MKVPTIVIIGLSLFLPGFYAPAFAEDVKISEQRADGVIQIFAENTSDKPLTITLELSDIVNATSNGWPTKAVKRALPGDRILMTVLMQVEKAPAATYSGKATAEATAQSPEKPPRHFTTSSIKQVPNSGPSPDKNTTTPPVQPFDAEFRYRLPYEAGTSHRVSQGYDGRSSHRGLYALDFDMPENTPVYASRDGLVVDIKDGRGSPDSDGAIGNFIAVKHADGTVAVYAQLVNHGACVSVGQRIVSGTVIGYSGTTGHCNGPHLHFEVDITSECVGVTVKGVRGSIPVVFDTRQGNKVSLQAQTDYTAE